jgi:DtxR family transcriptional regulator, manganese transport regulator
MTPTGEKEREAERQAKRHQRVRDAHQMELAEDYVELIADLIEQSGEARVVDLAGRLGVTNATVNNTIQRLQRDGLVVSRPYRSIFLTEQGQKLAKASRERHCVVREFLIALGVDAETADADAEGIEHHVSDATLEAFRSYLLRISEPGTQRRTGGSSSEENREFGRIGNERDD